MEWIGFLIFCSAVITTERVAAQRPYFGSCPKVKSARNVKIDKVFRMAKGGHNEWNKIFLTFRAPPFKVFLRAESWHMNEAGDFKIPHEYAAGIDCNYWYFAYINLSVENVTCYRILQECFRRFVGIEMCDLPATLTDKAGKWYEVERSFYIYEIPTSCTSLDITRPDNSTKELQVSIKTYNRWTRRAVVSHGKATPKGDGSAVLDYRVNSRLPEFLARFLPGAGRYTLLATDHDTYAVVYSCSDLGFIHTDLIWILGRKTHIPVWARAEAYDKLATAGFGTDQLTLSHRKNCQDS